MFSKEHVNSCYAFRAMDLSIVPYTYFFDILQWPMYECNAKETVLVNCILWPLYKVQHCHTSLSTTQHGSVRTYWPVVISTRPTNSYPLLHCGVQRNVLSVRLCYYCVKIRAK